MRLVSTCFVLGFNPSRQLSSTQPLVHPPHERIKKVNVWELVDRDKDSLQSRVKAVYTSKTRILLLLPIGRQMLSHSQENRRKKKKQENMHYISTSNAPPIPFSFFIPAFIALLMTTPLYEISLWPVWISCPVLFPSYLFTHGSSLVEQQRSGKFFVLV